MSKTDVVQAEIWKAYSEEFELKAFQEMTFMQNDELLFLLLTIPLPQIEHKSLLQLAIKQRSHKFLNNDGIRHAVNHLYQSKFLAPEQSVNVVENTSYDMLKLIVSQPFKFYFTAYGYHWTSGMLFMLYFAFICVYSYTQPFTSDNFDSQHQVHIEIALWIMNLGYILYEVFECAEKGLKRYMYTGPANILDFIISCIWIILFVVKYIHLCKERLKQNLTNHLIHSFKRILLCQSHHLKRKIQIFGTKFMCLVLDYKLCF